MDRADLQAISLTGMGLGATAIALAGQQLWPHAPWYIWFYILSFGIFIVLFSLVTLLHLHLSRIYKLWLSLCVILLLCSGAVSHYENLPDRSPLSLIEVYMTDFPQFFGQRSTYEFRGRYGVVPMVAIKHRDFASNAYFLSFYIYDTNDMYNACWAIAAKYKDVLSTINAQVLVSMRTPGDTTSSPDSDLRFTHIIYIYFNKELSPEQIGELHKQFADNDLIVQFRGWEYAVASFMGL
jgi:hypothetical protein